MRSPQESGSMLVQYVMELERRLVVTGHTSIVLYLCRVLIVNFVANQSCRLEDMFVWYSS